MSKIGVTIGILIPVLLIGTPIALAYGFCYDNSSSNVTYTEDFNSDEVANNIIFNSLNTTKDDKLVRFGISEQNINDLLKAAMANVDPTASKFIDTPYIKVNEEKKTVDFILHAHVPLFSTKLQISTSFTYRQADEQGPGGFLFKIHDVKIARLSALDLGLKIASHFINDETITSLLNQAGLHMTVSLKDRTMFYANEDLMNDVIKKSGIDNIYLSMVDFVLDNNLLDVSCAKDSIGLNFNLDKLTRNESYVDDSKSVHINEKYEKYKTDLEKLLNNSIISFEEAEDMMSFLTLGYEDCENSVQTLVDSKDLSSIGINDVKTYKGLDINSTRDITDVFNNQINTIDPLEIITKQKIDIKFDEDDFNETLKTSNIIGKSFTFVTKVNNVTKVNTIYIDDFYVNILNDQLDFVIGVNFNGLSSKLIIQSGVKEYDGKIIKLEISNIFFGELQANEEIKKACLDFVMDALTNLTDWFKADGNNRLIFFDLNTCVNQLNDETLKSFLSQARLSSAVVGNKLSDNGSLNISFIK